METKELKELLKAHVEWLEGRGGKRANLRRADLTQADLRGDDLTQADLRGANLTRTNLTRTNLREADLGGAYLSEANLTRTNLTRTNLSEANLTRADLGGADLTRTNLRGADLTRANLRGADLREANLSGAKNLLNPSVWLEKNFDFAAGGVLVYKRIGKTYHSPPEHWKIEEGAELTEVVNQLPTVECGCGVNFGTRKWCGDNFTDADLWQCLIPWKDLATLVVPYNTDGKARCGRLVLVKKIVEG
jgi:uncharacterized protein YjbI with pentapeptide repeats